MSDVIIVIPPNNGGDIDVGFQGQTDPARLLPSGGSLGQVLAKTSGADYVTAWVNQSGGGGNVTSVAGKTGAVTLEINDTVGLQIALDGKEALGSTASHVAAPDPHPQYVTDAEASAISDARIASSSLDALANVAAPSPSNGQILGFNGTNWVPQNQSAGGAAPFQTLKPASGRVFFPSFTNPTNTPAAGVAGRLYAYPMFVTSPATWTRIGFHVGTTHTASINVRLGIYADRPSASQIGPGALLFDSGDVATTAANTSQEIIINQTLTTGMYWLIIMVSGTTATLVTAPLQNSFGNSLFGVDGPNASNNRMQTFIRDRTYGALVDETSNAFAFNSVAGPAPYLRIL